MTRVYTNPAAPGTAQTRALIIGSGRYPFAKGGNPAVPNITDLSSVGPSVRAFVKCLIGDWRDNLAAPLATVDLLLAETVSPAGAKWSRLGVAGEVDQDAPIDAPTVPNVTAALESTLANAQPSDVLLFLCCGHGFWKEQRFFLLSDFGQNTNDPWMSVIALDDFSMGLRQKPPRKQWLFFDCCSDIPGMVLQTLGRIGISLIAKNAAALFAAPQKYGVLWQFGLASSTPGVQAFGIDNQPSRFCEMLIDAIGGTGAISRDAGGVWWVDHRGLEDAVSTYADRNPHLADPNFYRFVMPISSDTPGRMQLRRINGEPASHLICASVPAHRLKNAAIEIACQSAIVPCRSLPAPQAQAKLHVQLRPPRRYYTITATFDDNSKKQVEVFADLPLAEIAEFRM
jgi:hypothetical protein